MIIARKSRFVVPNDEMLILPFSDPPRYLPGVFFRTKQIKGTPLLQLVEAYRNAEQALVYARLGIDWKQACPARKFIMKGNRNETQTENELTATLQCL